MAAIPRQSTLVNQASHRIIAAIAVVSLIMGLATWWMQQIAYSRIATLESIQLNKDYQKFIHSEERLWNHEFNSLEQEFDHFKSTGSKDTESLKKFLAKYLSGKKQSSVVLADTKGKILFSDHSLPFLVNDNFFPESESGWFHPPGANLLIHYRSKKISLSDQVDGYLVLITPVDRALLDHLAFGNASLSLRWHGETVAPTEDEEEPFLIQEISCGIHSHGAIHDLRECIPWGKDATKNPILIVHKRIQPLITFEGLIAFILSIFLAVTLSVHILLGSWLGKITRRIVLLREFCYDYSRITRLTPTMLQTLATAKRHPEDEISTVADSLAQLAQGVEQRVIEQETKEKQLIESESRLREITSAIADGVMVLDSLGCITFLNPQGEQLLGWSEKELLGQNSHALLHHQNPDGSVKPEETCTIHQTVCSGTPARIYEDHFIRRDGSFLPIALASAPMVRNGQPSGAVITFQDMTEYLAMEQSVRENQNRFYELFNLMHDAAFVVALNPEGTFGRFLEVNQATCQRYGYSREELLQLTPENINSSNNQETLADLSQTILHQGHATFERWHRTRDGRHFPVEISSQLFKFLGQRAVLSSARDITERKEAEEIQKENENRFRTLIHSMSDAILLFNDQGNIILLNHSGTRMFGFDQVGFLDRPAASLFSQNRSAIQWGNTLRQLATDGIPLTMETVAQRLDGETFPAEVSLASWTQKGERFYSAVIRDISERKMLELRDLQAYIKRIAISALLEVALEPLPLKRKLEVAMDIIHTIPKMAIEAKGSIMLLTDEGDLELVVERHLSTPLLEKCKRIPLGHCLCGRAAQSKEMIFVNSVDDRHDITFEGIQPHGHYCVPILSYGQLLGVLNLYVSAGHAQDPEEAAFLTTVANTLAGLIERGRAEEKIRHMANHDPLTGLPNRALFHEHLDQELRRAQRGKRSLVIAFMDLDRFKQVNDTLGHEAGDILLKQVTQRLRLCLRDSDTLARLGGDEFTLILPEIDNPPNAATVAEKIIATIQEPFLILGQSCEIGVSIGMSRYPEHATQAEELLQKADQAMYAVKNSGRNAFRFFRE